MHAIAGVVLSREELCQLQCPGTPYRVRGRNCRCGTGLLSSYNLTDLPMAISGKPTKYLSMHFLPDVLSSCLVTKAHIVM